MSFKLIAPAISLTGMYSPAMSASAAEESNGWFECFETSIPEDLPDDFVDETLANRGFGKAREPEVLDRVVATLVPCVLENGGSDEDLDGVAVYALQMLGLEGSRNRLLSMGISPEFLDLTAETFRREVAGEDTREEIRAALRAESERAGLSGDLLAQVQFLLVVYADSRLAIEQDPPSI